ncbi:MAG TPA: DUF2267 domain-containing protein [Arthrobacter sp.]|jgi:uncharacterized protein (DUF2267 family)|nr:DUF2267 domain-containing protein [Arthrobacter sp.]
MDFEQFVNLVANRADVAGWDRAQALINGTLRTLAERISGGEARDLAAQLPEEFKPSLSDAEETAETFTVDEFVRRVAERAGVGDDTALKGARAVMATVRDAVTSGEWDDIIAQLPKHYSELIGSSTS